MTYFWMYGPRRELPCPMCTAFLGLLDIPARDITQRAALAVLGRSPVERQLAFARDPGQDPRLAPDPTPLWNILDLTPAGRGSDWYPKLEYQ